MNEMIFRDEDVAKYKKKTESDISKASRKAKHRHSYKECLVVSKAENNRIFICSYCTECGKIYNIITPTERTERGMYRLLEPYEIAKKYSYLKTIYMNNIRDIKYLPLEILSE